MAGEADKLFAGGTVLCDGAMGTMLYSCGVFINRCYDELNLSQPDTVRSVHDQYLQAGAEVIETNTFGANRFRLELYGLTEKLREINIAGARIARKCVDAMAEKQGAQAFVAGAVGSLGVKLDPAGSLTPGDARVAFAEQIAALAEGGVDLLILETMMSVAEAEQAVLAARDAAPHLKAVVLMTVDEEGNCLDGASPEEAAERLTRVGADAIGCNCSSGPAIVLTVIERMRAVTGLPLVAMPNAGMPRNVEGRNIYLTSPEYMGSFARKFVRAGASWVGGCCGTTPAHIRSMRGSLRAMEAQDQGEKMANQPNVQVAAAAAEGGVEPLPLVERSKIGRMIATGEFVTLVEIVPPKGFDCSKELAGAELLARRGVHAINVPDSPRASARMSAQSLCVQIQQKVGIETVLHYTCRDRNILGIQGDLLGVRSSGLRNILCLTGDPPKMGNYPDATAVFDVDAIGLVGIVQGLNHGFDLGRNPIGGSTGFTVAVAANPGVPDLDHEVRRFAAKVEAGGEYCITQPVFDQRLLEQFLRRIEGFRIPVIAGIWPLTSVRNAEFMKNELKVSMPEDLMARMAAAPDKESAMAEGIKIAREMLEQVRADVQGVQVSAPFSKYGAAAEVLGLQEVTVG
ncbi:MAG TPA: bifunctional homocysteine S-methyltransferase/methylenetetrahydrofolate reductase [Acidobacteriaceae bacterium]|jgi:homocysteine S-methyltransferase